MDCILLAQDMSQYLTLVNSVNGPTGFHELWRFLDFCYGSAVTSV